MYARDASYYRGNSSATLFIDPSPHPPAPLPHATREYAQRVKAASEHSRSRTTRSIHIPPLRLLSLRPSHAVLTAISLATRVLGTRAPVSNVRCLQTGREADRRRGGRKLCERGSFGVAWVVCERTRASRAAARATGSPSRRSNRTQSKPRRRAQGLRRRPTCAHTARPEKDESSQSIRARKQRSCNFRWYKFMTCRVQKFLTFGCFGLCILAVDKVTQHSSGQSDKILLLTTQSDWPPTVHVSIHPPATQCRLCGDSAGELSEERLTVILSPHTRCWSQPLRL